ncbi:MAG TPA: SulP family inorganic anion transporter, partial [Desulfomonilaceae bacterium]|nr:SulP family inorganic anion transporter [Desulfomonilaceae bacterium]
VNASLAGLAPEHGLYAFLLGGLVYSLFSRSRHAAVAATSTVSIMIGSFLGVMGIEDATKYAEMAACTAILVGIISFFAWLLRLSDVVSFISETILSGFKLGAALVIASTQLPKIMGIKAGGHNFFERIYYYSFALPVWLNSRVKRGWWIFLNVLGSLASREILREK